MLLRCAAISWSGRELVLPAGLPVVDIDAVDVSEFDGSVVTDADRVAPLRSSNVAYVILHVGFDGSPEGCGGAAPQRGEVVCEYRAVCSGSTQSDVWTMFHSLCVRLLGVGVVGSAVVRRHVGGGGLCDVAVAGAVPGVAGCERVTVLNQTPSAFYQLAEADRWRRTPVGCELALRWWFSVARRSSCDGLARLVRPPR